MWAGINAATARRLGVPGMLPKPRKPRATKQAQEQVPVTQVEAEAHFDTVKDYGLEGSLRAMNCCHCKQAQGDKRTLHQGCCNFANLLEEATAQDKVLACEKYMAKAVCAPHGCMEGEVVTAAKCCAWEKAARKLTLNRLPALGVVAWADVSM